MRSTEIKKHYYLKNAEGVRPRRVSSCPLSRLLFQIKIESSIFCGLRLLAPPYLSSFRRTLITSCPLSLSFVSFAKDLAAGGTAGAVSKTIVAPIEVRGRRSDTARLCVHPRAVYFFYRPCPPLTLPPAPCARAPPFRTRPALQRVKLVLQVQDANKEQIPVDKRYKGMVSLRPFLRQFLRTDPNLRLACPPC